MRARRPDKRLDAAKRMPALHHTLPGKGFDAKSSEVLQWLASQPELMLYLFDKAKGNGLIEYDAATGTWKGASS